jgi:hypothetical protein
VRGRPLMLRPCGRLPPIVLDGRVHAGEGVPEHGLVSGQNGTAEVLLQRLDRADRAKPLPPIIAASAAAGTFLRAQP